MIRFFKSLFINNRFFIYISIISALFLLSFWIHPLYKITWLLLYGFILLMLIDVLILFRFKEGVNSKRIVPDKLSNSDENSIAVTLENKYPFQVYLSLIDELPVQFQKRDFSYKTTLNPQQKTTFNYNVTPVERGVYTFGKTHVYVSSILSIFSKRYSFKNDKDVKVYPSYIQMKKFEFLAMHNNLTEFGLKKIRRIGHTMEFEQIKEYVIGDDVRRVNWKATAKRGSLMMNQYQDEKSQPIYSVIDLGRVMKMPFDGLQLLDYAINSSLAFSNIALLKNDKAGLLTFSKEINTIVAATNKKTNLSVINEELYSIKTNFLDANFALLNATIRRKINQRSLLILYTNFEHMSALKRQLPYLKAMSKKHLLLVVLFENTELKALIDNQAENLQDVYHKTIAEKYAFEKRLMVKELEKNNIHSILTKPKELSVNVINRYLEFKSRGMI